MMVPKKSLFLAGAALICLAAAPNAQKNGKRGPLYTSMRGQNKTGQNLLSFGWVVQLMEQLRSPISPNEGLQFS